MPPDDLIEALTQQQPNNTHSLEMRIDGLIASLWRLDDTRSTNAGGNDDSRSVHVNNDDYVSTDTSGDETTADVPADGLFALKRPLPELSHYFYTRQLCLHLILTLCF